MFPLPFCAISSKKIKTYGICLCNKLPKPKAIYIYDYTAKFGRLYKNTGEFNPQVKILSSKS